MQWLELYKHVMHPSHPTLCVFAMVNSLGNESLVGEMQARWALAVLGGGAARPCPSRERMTLEVARRSAQVRSREPKFAAFVPYTKYCDDLAADIGCMPRALDWWSIVHPAKWSLLWALVFTPLKDGRYLFF